MTVSYEFFGSDDLGWHDFAMCANYHWHQTTFAVRAKMAGEKIANAAVDSNPGDRCSHCCVPDYLVAANCFRDSAVVEVDDDIGWNYTWPTCHWADNALAYDSNDSVSGDRDVYHIVAANSIVSPVFGYAQKIHPFRQVSNLCVAHSHDPRVILATERTYLCQNHNQDRSVFRSRMHWTMLCSFGQSFEWTPIFGRSNSLADTAYPCRSLYRSLSMLLFSSSLDSLCR